jgi:hypothetical protein
MAAMPQQSPEYLGSPEGLHHRRIHLLVARCGGITSWVRQLTVGANPVVWPRE